MSDEQLDPIEWFSQVREAKQAIMAQKIDVRVTEAKLNEAIQKARYAEQMIIRRQYERNKSCAYLLKHEERLAELEKHEPPTVMGEGNGET